METKLLEKKIEALRGAYQHSIQSVSDAREELREAKEEAVLREAAQDVLQNIAQGLQNQAHDKISSIVTRCLASIFDDSYTFRIHFEQKRNRTEPRLVFERDGREFNPLKATGGGVVEMAAFALRLAFIVLNRPAGRRVMILDEPFKAVSADYRSRIASLLNILAKEMEVQFIIVTHIDELQTGTVVQFT